VRQIGGAVNEAMEQLIKIGQSFPCEYSPLDAPHPPYLDAKWFCDGDGYLRQRDGNGVSTQRCGCYQKWKRRQDIDERLKAFNDQLTPRMRQDLSMAARGTHVIGELTRSWNYRTPAVFIAGDSGLGKSVAACMIMTEWMSRQVIQGLYLTTDMIAENAKAMAEEGNNAAAMKSSAWRQASQNRGYAIILDDIGRERTSEAVRAEIGLLIRHMYDHGLRCVITGNLAKGELASKYGNDIASRIGDKRWCTLHRCSGKDQRPREWSD